MLYGAWPVSVCSPTSHDLKPTAPRISSHELFTKYHPSSEPTLQEFLVEGLKWLGVEYQHRGGQLNSRSSQGDQFTRIFAKL